MINSRLKRLITQSFHYFKPDLRGMNILLPSSVKDASILPAIASLAGADNIYVMSNDSETINKTILLQEELGLENKVHFISSEKPEMLSEIDIIIPGKGISEINAAYIKQLKKSCVLSVLPQNLDFFRIRGINFDDCTFAGIPVISINPADYGLMLYRYFAHKLIEMAYKADLEVYRSRLLLVGNADFLENAVSLFKAAGAQVFAFDTAKNQNNDYIIKHLPEVDAVVVMDYPNSVELVIGKNGVITVDDLLATNPSVNIINFAGKIDYKQLLLANINIVPHGYNDSHMNITIDDIGLRTVIETSTAVIKVAESFINARSKNIQYQNSVVRYNIINAGNSMVLGKVL